MNIEICRLRLDKNCTELFLTVRAAVKKPTKKNLRSLAGKVRKANRTLKALHRVESSKSLTPFPLTTNEQKEIRAGFTPNLL